MLVDSDFKELLSILNDNGVKYLITLYTKNYAICSYCSRS